MTDMNPPTRRENFALLWRCERADLIRALRQLARRRPKYHLDGIDPSAALKHMQARTRLLNAIRVALVRVERVTYVPDLWAAALADNRLRVKRAETGKIAIEYVPIRARSLEFRAAIDEALKAYLSAMQIDQQGMDAQIDLLEVMERCGATRADALDNLAQHTRSIFNSGPYRIIDARDGQIWMRCATETEARACLIALCACGLRGIYIDTETGTEQEMPE